MIAFTNCKINIGLDVIKRRADGYHDLVTCMLPVPWHDVLEVVPSNNTQSSLTVLGNPVDCPPEKNLVMKAYRMLESEYSLPPIDIVLQKIVPDGAGLGGGSADATHMLKMLDKMFGLSLDNELLARKAAKLGADCAFFVYDRPMICTGIGDIMRPVNLPLNGYSILIIKPNTIAVSTKDAYAGITPSVPQYPLEELLRLPVDQWQGKIKNDFEKSIFPKCPEIESLKYHMIDCGAVYASMSGSGASVYGIFNNKISAENALAGYENNPHFIFDVES